MPRRLIVEADGASRGNPGAAAYGALVRDAETGRVLVEMAEHIGTASNNVAEYRGAIAGVTAARDLDPEAQVEVRMDSKLVVEQLSGRWQVKHPDMKVLVKKALSIWPDGDVHYTWVPRERNKDADRLANEALDAALKGLPWTRRTDGGTEMAGSSRTVVGWGSHAHEPTTFRLLRHGETVHTNAKRFSGSGGDDPSLTEAGRGQAEAAARSLATRGGVDVVVCSPLARTLETAGIVADALGLEIEVDDDVAECAFGDWEGLTFVEVQQAWPDALSAWLGSTAVAPPGGESFDEVTRRVRRSRDRILEVHASRTVLVVSHVTPIKVLVGLALEAPSSALYRMELSPASLTTIAWYSDGNVSLRSFNDVAHLGQLV